MKPNEETQTTKAKKPTEFVHLNVLKEITFKKYLHLAGWTVMRLNISLMIAILMLSKHCSKLSNLSKKIAAYSF